MTKVVITGARGFIGRNLAAYLTVRKDCETQFFDRGESPDKLAAMLTTADVVFHLAGVNRPQDPREFETGNAVLTESLCESLRALRRSPKIVFSSSTQAGMQNPYGISKRKAEQYLQAFADESNASVRIYRLKNVFGKWCRPNYNSVVATFCHNIARDYPISVSNPATVIELSYIDDVVHAFLAELNGESTPESIPGFPIRLDTLAGQIQGFRDLQDTLRIPDLHSPFSRALFATFCSYVPEQDRMHRLHKRSDARGNLAEFLKSEHAGQVFISRTAPGVTRGNHYHHTKTEKFLVLEGDGIIRMRLIDSKEISEYRVSGSEYDVVNIPPGYTHSITNIGPSEMTTLFWASEVFDPDNPDTYYQNVDDETRPPLAEPPDGLAAASGLAARGR